MTKEKFNQEIGKFIGGPEHTAYYDVNNILDICINYMTDIQLDLAYKEIESKMVEA